VDGARRAVERSDGAVRGLLRVSLPPLGAEFMPFGVRLNVSTMIYELDPEFEQGNEAERKLEGNRRPSAEAVLRLVEEKPMKRPQLIEAVMERFGCGKSSAYTLISTALDDRLVEKAKSGELVPSTPPAA
jgi:hypothetical protein